MGSASRHTKGIGRASSPLGSPADATDSTIHVLERAQRGDQSAVRTLIERAAPPVRRWAHHRLPSYARSDADTEDVVQDAVLRMLKNIKRVKHVTVGGLQAYLRESVLNRIRDLIRKTQRHGVPLEVDADVRDDMPSPLVMAIRRERLERFLEALQRLRPADRQVIVWRVELGYSAEEIASRLGKSKAAAGMAVSRAMARLEKELKLQTHAT
jgi:RNA polymerase sigma-70 factor, ECF subfamily